MIMVATAPTAETFLWTWSHPGCAVQSCERMTLNESGYAREDLYGVLSVLIWWSWSSKWTKQYSTAHADAPYLTCSYGQSLERTHRQICSQHVLDCLYVVRRWPSLAPLVDSWWCWACCEQISRWGAFGSTSSIQSKKFGEAKSSQWNGAA
jgi:hypothetical protein